MDSRMSASGSRRHRRRYIVVLGVCIGQMEWFALILAKRRTTYLFAIIIRVAQFLFFSRDAKSCVSAHSPWLDGLPDQRRYDAAVF